MEKINHDEDFIYTELFEIWADRIKTKTYTYEAFEFERNAGAEMRRQAKMLSDLSWHCSGYNTFEIHHPDREINAPLYADRIGQAWIVEKYIKPYVTPLVMPNNMACQDGKGSYETLKRVKEALDLTYKKYGKSFWVFQYDMEGYYDNLNHAVIKDQYSGMPPKGFQLLCNIVDGWHSEDCYALKRNPDGTYGRPKGCLPSQWDGVLYLNDLDWLILELFKPELIIRYMDDCIVLLRTKEECIELYHFIEDYLNKKEMGIRMHPRKTYYAPISRGFNFCGWHYAMSNSGKVIIHLKQSKKREMYDKFEALQEAYKNGKLSYKEVTARMKGHMNYLKWGNTGRLRKYISERFVFSRDDDRLQVSDYYDDYPTLTEQEYYDLLADECINGLF